MINKFYLKKRAIEFHPVDGHLMIEEAMSILLDQVKHDILAGDPIGYPDTSDFGFSGYYKWRIDMHVMSNYCTSNPEILIFIPGENK